jgi:hypothetical protein
MNQLTKITTVLGLCITISMHANAQANESPAGAYQWKRGKTEWQVGYVVLKSGKRMDGKISLIGSATQVNEVAYEGNGKEIKFPAASLQSYGLVGINLNASTSVSGGPINESPETMYEWRNMGVVMNKVITSSTPRAGYVVLHNGTKYEGELKLRRKDGILEDIEVKTVGGKEKFDAPEVARYGYTVSQEEVAQTNLAKQSKTAFQGTIATPTGMQAGEITIIPLEGKRYRERIIFKGSDGKLVDHTTKTISGFTYRGSKGREVTYVVIDDKFVVEQFQGKTFQVYLNPNPTTINEFATSLVKGAVSVGTSAAASAAVKKDAKKNNYETNMDSVIRVSSTEDLKTLRDQMASLAGYESAEDAINNSDNESLRTNLGALEIAIQGREVASTPGGILNEEWIIYNKITNEKTIVYKSKYKEQIDVLLMGCDKYFELTKPAQNDLQKWDNLAEAMKLLDNCY